MAEPAPAPVQVMVLGTWHMDNPGQDQWRIRLDMAKLWAEAVNRHGGDATVVHLPEIGIHGNTHFPFSDLNNLEIADLMEEFLEKKGLN